MYEYTGLITKNSNKNNDKKNNNNRKKIRLIHVDIKEQQTSLHVKWCHTLITIHNVHYN